MAAGRTIYSLEATETILRDVASIVSTDRDDTDLVAAEATRGALRAEVAGIEVHVALGQSSGEAENGYEVFGAFMPEDGLERDGNVVIAWSGTAPDDDREAVKGCLQ